jgi:hypothetical protein
MQLEERTKDWSFETCLSDVFLALVHYTTHGTAHTNTTPATQDLRVCRRSCAVCVCGVSVVAFLRMYTTYINNYTQAVYTFQRL